MGNLGRDDPGVGRILVTQASPRGPCVSGGHEAGSQLSAQDVEERGGGIGPGCTAVRGLGRLVRPRGSGCVEESAPDPGPSGAGEASGSDKGETAAPDPKA